MRHAVRSDLLASPIKRLLTFSDPKYFRVQRFVCSPAPHPLKQRASVGNQRDTTQFPILCSSRRIAAHNNLPCLKIYVAPCDLARFTNSAACERQTSRKDRAVNRIATVPCAHFGNQRVEFLRCWQSDLFASHSSSFDDR